MVPEVGENVYHKTHCKTYPVMSVEEDSVELQNDDGEVFNVSLEDIELTERSKYVEFKKVWRINPEDLPNPEEIEDEEVVKHRALEMYNEETDIDEILMYIDNIENVSDHLVLPGQKQMLIDEVYRQLDEVLLELRDNPEDINESGVMDRIRAARFILSIIKSIDAEKLEALSVEDILDLVNQDI